MKMSNSFFFTRREFPKDEKNISSKLLIKSGMVLKNSNGVYSYLPMGTKVINNIKKIINEELNKINASEVFVPSLIPSDVFELSGREKIFGKEMYKLVDRNNKSFYFISIWK